MSHALSRLAQADLDGIWDYSADRWSIRQADDYVGRIQAAFLLISEEPKRGRLYRGRRRPYRRFSVGSHVIFYREGSERVEVVRILHQSMDFDRHL